MLKTLSYSNGINNYFELNNLSVDSVFSCCAKVYRLLIILTPFFISGCITISEGEKTIIDNVPEYIHPELPEHIVDKSSLVYDNYTSQWTLDDQLFSGYAISYYTDSTTKEKFGILNGKKQNQHTIWYPNGGIKQLANYQDGKLHGEKKSWSADSNHTLISSLNYVNGKAHGVQKTWYPTGELFKKLNMNMGREEGLQQAFRKNGDLYANYEARDGRIYGLKKSALCFGLEDENIEY